jgi:hypothetical protein
MVPCSRFDLPSSTTIVIIGAVPTLCDAEIGQTRRFGFLAYSMEMVNMGLVLGLCLRGEYGARMPKTEVKRSG